MISKEMNKNLSINGGIREAFNEARRQKALYGDENVYDLSIGNPSAPVPRKVTEVLKDFCGKKELDHQYMCESGYEEVREKIADHLNQKYNTGYGINNIIMTNGVAGGINIVLRALLNPGDEVIIFRPYYPAYKGFVENWQGKIVEVNPKEDFQPDFEDLEHKITIRTKVVIVNSPHNPTGVIYTKETAAKISEILKSKQKEYGHAICLLSDEPYRDLVYIEEELPWWPDFYRNTIVSYSFSKSLSLAGERIGYLTIPTEVEDSENVIKAVRLAMGRLGFVNAPALFQRIVGECIDEQVDLEYYAKNRQILYGTLKQCGYECIEPKGAFYIFVKAPDNNEERFLELARKRHLIFVGGSSFGYSGYVRLSFCCKYEVLQRATDALKHLADDCRLTAS
ncbi:pyridoxal phosphate-dependent aminotransferase [Dorea formicigenerans]|uniref:Aminotransferase n=1 Tax=Dorea formicigenerans TaxID=39486 RepID=A0A413SM77_9FIRM|nr:pyridoxal phosphate-dependent aminotransferase [Dorea formicigenerans]RHA68915.1 pyridoxal phosphate-dependent aminotransferase [Dorea formicigenerans]